LSSVESFDGVRLAYDVLGDGDVAGTIVFVHGWTCNRTHWRDQVAAFSDRYRVIAIDLAGHGESGLDRSNYSMVSFARDVEAVLDKEQISNAVLVGHSMGGMVILHSARLLGDRVVGLVGADTFKFLKLDPGAGSGAEQLEQFSENFESAAADVVSNMFAPETSESLRKFIADGMLNVSKDVAVGAMRGMAEDEPLFELADGLDIPMMTINASQRPFDADSAREAGIDVRMMKTTGHFVMNEEPEAFNSHLEDALGRMFD
jgi:pimeloyl-ACP methyl ester carboxylesterase